MLSLGLDDAVLNVNFFKCLSTMQYIAKLN